LSSLERTKDRTIKRGQSREDKREDNQKRTKERTIKRGLKRGQSREDNQFFLCPLLIVLSFVLS
jgi:hypothetical protein